MTSLGGQADCDLRIHNRFIWIYVREGRLEGYDQQEGFAEALGVSVSEISDVIERDDFVTAAALEYLRVSPRAELRYHSEYARDFVRRHMVDWERDEFAESLGITGDQLGSYMTRDDFLSDEAMDVLRNRAGLGLMVPVAREARVELRRVRENGSVSYLVDVIRRRDGEIIETAGHEDDGFDGAVSELMLLGGPSCFEDHGWITRMYGIM